MLPPLTPTEIAGRRVIDEGFDGVALFGVIYPGEKSFCNVIG